MQRKLDSALIDAVSKDDLVSVKRLLMQGANPSAIRIRYRTIFSLGHVKDACDSALIIACRRGTVRSHEIIKTLTASGANAAYVNFHGESAVLIIKKQRDKLLQMGVDSILIDFLIAILKPVAISTSS
jgi:ankyrin repeat protein